MFKFVILLAVMACALGAVVPKGMLPQLDGRIVGGYPASVNGFPWQISLQRSGMHSCGGSIYSERVVITASHCVRNVVPSVLRVRAGSSLWISGGVLLRVASCKSHEGYDPYTVANDIGIVVLSSSLIFSSTIKPIDLAYVAPENGAAAAVSGWGTTVSGSDSIPTQLKAVDMRIVSREQCASDIYGYGTNIDPTMICTYGIDKDACQGDSGGPLVSGGFLVGVVSWGYGCAFRNYPGVYANVAELRSWVIENVDSI